MPGRFYKYAINTQNIRAAMFGIGAGALTGGLVGYGAKKFMDTQVAPYTDRYPPEVLGRMQNLQKDTGRNHNQDFRLTPYFTSYFPVSFPSATTFPSIAFLKLFSVQVVKSIALSVFKPNTKNS